MCLAWKSQDAGAQGCSTEKEALVDRTGPSDGSSGDADLISINKSATIRRTTVWNGLPLKGPTSEHQEVPREKQGGCDSNFLRCAGLGRCEKHLGGFLKLHVLCPRHAGMSLLQSFAESLLPHTLAV